MDRGSDRVASGRAAAGLQRASGATALDSRPSCAAPLGSDQSASASEMIEWIFSRAAR